VVGHGYWGKNHVRNFHQLGALRVVCDRDEERLRVALSKYPDCDVEISFASVLSRADIDGVVLATPAETHFRLAKECLAAGKDVLVEKPLALRVSEGEELVALAESAGRILMVGHILEYHPAIEALTALVRDGGLGKIQYVYSNRLNLGKVRREENILWSFAPHDVAILLRLLGELPETVAASGGNYLHPSIADVTVSNFSFPGGVRAHIHVSWLHPFKEQKLVVVGDQAMAVFDDQAKELTVYDHAIDWVDRLPVPRKAEGRLIDYGVGEPLAAECEAFLTSIETREPPITDGQSGLGVLRVLSRCQESLELGGVLLPLQKATDEYYVHPTAVVDDGATIGQGSKVWHFSHVMGSATLGAGCILGQNVFVADNCTLGSRVKVQNNVSIYKGVTLEDDVFCGPSMVFTNVRNPRAHVERKHAFAATHVGKGATLGANCTVVCGNTIGRYAMVAAGAVVTSDVPEYALVMGVPARIQGWMCPCGERLDVGAQRPSEAVSCQHCGETIQFS
jgi:UDP-2-acetamido-3-amino-2,3-dideoxy-glucuronate N-acetyltransferase